MTTSMQPSATQRRIEQQLQGGIVYLHKSSGVRYQVTYTSGGVSQLHPISGASRQVPEEQLSNAEVWEKQ
ncbi:hypothetical protein E8E95_05545 [Pseudomonas sp. BN414]|uniref:hypothetical protein n=1 Tax=Pseudomonas sp. BN414 TaxID=2567888 RepID=UPI0024581F68|nr:hypothetical protein [Pseudomonas sp. BN414]MDH4566136.1 hypothetical protein [Pseudomonas sp. BN414]